MATPLILKDLAPGPLPPLPDSLLPDIAKNILRTALSCDSDSTGDQIIFTGLATDKKYICTYQLFMTTAPGEPIRLYYKNDNPILFHEIVWPRVLNILWRSHLIERKTHSVTAQTDSGELTISDIRMVLEFQWAIAALSVPEDIAQCTHLEAVQILNECLIRPEDEAVYAPMALRILRELCGHQSSAVRAASYRTLCGLNT